MPKLITEKVTRLSCSAWLCSDNVEFINEKIWLNINTATCRDEYGAENHNHCVNAPGKPMLARITVIVERIKEDRKEAS
jgi:hypothetical protein